MRLVHLIVSTREQRALEAIKNNAISLADNIGSNTRLALARALSKELEGLVPEFVARYRELKTRPGLDAMVVDQLPIFRNAPEELAGAKVWAMSIAMLLGEPFQYSQQNGGEIAAEVTPTSDLENTSSSGGKIDLGWHSDDSFLRPRFRTKWIQLLGFHNPDRVVTNVALVDDILRGLNREALAHLMQRKYQVRLPASFRLGDAWSEPLPIIRINDDNIEEISVPTYNVRPIDPLDTDGKRALASLIAAADCARQAVCLERSKVLVFNNDRLLHARGRIRSNRMVLRVYVKPDVTSLRRASRTDGSVFDIASILKSGQPWTL